MKILVDESALRQSLEALEKQQETLKVWPDYTLAPHECAAMDASEKAITTLRAVLAHCASPETQNTELDRKAASAKRGEALYHPCTYILIQGLKKLNAYDVLAEWDKTRAEVDALALRPTKKVK